MAKIYKALIIKNLQYFHLCSILRWKNTWHFRKEEEKAQKAIKRIGMSIQETKVHIVNKVNLLAFQILVHLSLFLFIKNTIPIQIIFCKNCFNLCISMATPGNQTENQKLFQTQRDSFFQKEPQSVLSTTLQLKPLKTVAIFHTMRKIIVPLRNSCYIIRGRTWFH